MPTRGAPALLLVVAPTAAKCACLQQRNLWITIQIMIEIRKTAVFEAWFSTLRDRQAHARISIRIDRLALGKLGDTKPVGRGVCELRIHYGPGHRVDYVR